MGRILFLFLLSLNLFGKDILPEWYIKLEKPNVVKDFYIRLILPEIEAENQRILEDRKFIESIFQDNFLENIQDKEKLSKLAKIAKHYKIDKLFSEIEYLKKVDIIPNSLALAQSAVESGWGKSEHSKFKKNLFGHYKNSKIIEFKSLKNSIATYMHNLNTNLAYENFRKARMMETKLNGGDFSGSKASRYLSNYSESGKDYTKHIKSTIYKHKFSKFDKIVAIKEP